MSSKLSIGFLDASGNFDFEDRFFGVGMLVVNEPGCLTDALHKIFQRILILSQDQRNQAVNRLIQSGNVDEVIRLLKKTKRFEMKYDRITPIKFALYKEAIDVFLKNPQCRFSCMIIDRNKEGFNRSFFNNSWNAYTSYVSTLVKREARNLIKQELFLVLDDISKPNSVSLPLEEIILRKAKHEDTLDEQNRAEIIGAIRIESHSNLLMQLNDILLGCVMLSFKMKVGVVSEKLIKRKGEVVYHLSSVLGKNILAETFTLHKPNYFSVWEVDFRKNKSGESDK